MIPVLDILRGQTGQPSPCMIISNICLSATLSLTSSLRPLLSVLKHIRERRQTNAQTSRAFVIFLLCWQMTWPAATGSRQARGQRSHPFRLLRTKAVFHTSASVSGLQLTLNESSGLLFRIQFVSRFK